MNLSLEQNNLPKGWTLAELRHVVENPKEDIVDGPFGSNLKANEYTESGIPVFKIQNIKANQFIDKNIKFIKEKKAKELNRHSFTSGDLIITKLGAPLGLCCKVPETYSYGIIVADLIRLRPSTERIFDKYLIYAINGFFVQNQFKAITKGTTRPRVNLTIVRNIKIPYPPLSEQHQIVAKIEELFSELDNGIENLKKAREQLKIYRQAVLKYAFEGKLTKEWRSLRRRAGNPPEPAKRLLERIRKERETHYKKQVKDWEKAVKEWEENGKEVKKPGRPKRFKDMPEFSEEESGSLTSLPRSWEWIRINESVFDLNDDIVDGPFGSNLKNSDYVDDGTVPVIGISNIDEGFKTKIRYVTKEKFETISRSAVYPGNIIVAKIGSSYGKTGIYPEWMPVGLIPANLLRIKPSKHFIRELLVHYLQSSIFKKRLDKIMKSSAQPAYNVSIFRNLPVPFCSIEEQKELLNAIESRLSVCYKLEQTIEDSLKKAEALRQSILKKAFEGELTRDWREKHPELITGENSAEKLLERIKAEKAHACRQASLSVANRKKPQSKKMKLIK